RVTRLRTSTHTGAITTTAIRNDRTSTLPWTSATTTATWDEEGELAAARAGRVEGVTGDGIVPVGAATLPRRGVRSDHPRRCRPSGRPAPGCSGPRGGRRWPRACRRLDRRPLDGCCLGVTGRT